MDLVLVYISVEGKTSEINQIRQTWFQADGLEGNNIKLTFIELSCNL